MTSNMINVEVSDQCKAVYSTNQQIYIKCLRTDAIVCVPSYGNCQIDPPLLKDAFEEKTHTDSQRQLSLTAMFHKDTEKRKVRESVTFLRFIYLNVFQSVLIESMTNDLKNRTIETILN